MIDKLLPSGLQAEDVAAVRKKCNAPDNVVARRALIDSKFAVAGHSARWIYDIDHDEVKLSILNFE